ncbi:MAG: NAD(+)/NADH kinase, partial [bacterium]|nr:NAD(+)/NADH kinase [bacterium]
MKYKNFGIVYNPIVKNSEDVATALTEVLVSRNLSFTKFSIDSLKTDVDFVFVIGGDGTLLSSARFYSKYSIPVFGVNLGRLGFLAQVSVEELEAAVDAIINDKCVVEDRLMLTASEDLLALNDFVIRGVSSYRTSRFYLNINSKFVCDYLADGIIIATPTGSTAYGLSAGGPILAPQLDVVAIIPICPHTLTARPLVVPATEKISVTISDSGQKFNVVADGQYQKTLSKKIDIQKSQFQAKLALVTENNDFYSVLRKKLNWGVAPR